MAFNFAANLTGKSKEMTFKKKNMNSKALNVTNLHSLRSAALLLYFCGTDTQNHYFCNQACLKLT